MPALPVDSDELGLGKREEPVHPDWWISPDDLMCSHVSEPLEDPIPNTFLLQVLRHRHTHTHTHTDTERYTHTQDANTYTWHTAHIHPQDTHTLALALVFFSFAENGYNVKRGSGIPQAPHHLFNMLMKSCCRGCAATVAYGKGLPPGLLWWEPSSLQPAASLTLSQPSSRAALVPRVGNVLFSVS